MNNHVNYRAIGNKIKHKRKSLSLTQEQLAERAGISAPFLGHIERGTRAASLASIISIAEALNTTPGQLIDCSAVQCSSSITESEKEHVLSLLDEAIQALQKTSFDRRNDDGKSKY